MSRQVLIIGAGITGLTAAWRLATRGFAVEILERRTVTGGMAGSISQEGFVIDHGIHGWYSARPETRPLVDELHRAFGQDFLTVQKKTSIYFNDQYLKYPLGVKELFRALPMTTSALCLADFIATRVRKRISGAGEGESFREWVTDRFGARLYDIYFGPYVEKVWGLPGWQMSSAWLARRIEELSLVSIVKRALLRLVRSGHPDEEMQSLQPATFLYPPRGSGQLADRVRQAAEAAGARITFGATVTDVERTDQRITRVHISLGKQAEERTPDYLISTIPLPAFIRLLGPDEREVSEAARGLRFRALVFVNLFIDRPQVYKEQWVYYPDPALPFNRINEYTNLGPKFSPPGRTALNCEITCWVDDETWIASEEELAERCLGSLEALGMVSRDDVFAISVARLPTAYPVFDVDCEARLTIALDFVHSHENVFTLGRQGRFEYINQDECVWHATTCAEEIASREGIRR